MPGKAMARRIDISKINFSGFIMLALLIGLMATALSHPPSEYRVPKITEQDRRVTAYHESGHALLAANLPASGGILNVTIVSRWGMLGGPDSGLSGADIAIILHGGVPQVAQEKTG